MESVLKEIREMKGELKMEMKDMHKDMHRRMKDMSGAMEFINEKFEFALRELKEAQEELVEARKENEKYKEMVGKLNVKVDSLEEQVAKMKNDKLEANIELSGMKCEKNENCKEKVLKVLKKCMPELKEADIVDSFRIGKAIDDAGKINEYRTMVVKFKSKNVRDTVMRKKKEIRSSYDRTTGKGIFINENLCSETKALLRKVNLRRKEMGWKFLWTSGGKILVRKENGSKVVWVRSEEGIGQIN